MAILEIAIVGAILSGIVQWAKKKWGTEGLQTKILTVVLALIVGALVFFFEGTTYWQAVIGILASASTVYAFFWK